MSSDSQLLVTIDQVISRRANTHDQSPVLSYAGETDFAQYTGADIERLSRYAANAYMEILSDVAKESAKTVAMVGISNMEYYVTFLALQRVGITAMLISPRLPDQGFAHLLQKTGCRVAIASQDSQKSLERACQSASLNISILPMLDAGDFVNPTFINRFGGPLKPVDTSDQQGFIIHSGGTTGLPKPIRLFAKAWLLQAANVAGRMPQVDTLTTLPLFHSFGVATLLRCLVNGNCLSIMNATRPITASTIMLGLEKTSSEALVTVPYILRFFTEIDGGVERLAQLRQVISAGSAIPDDLGNQLSDAGAKLYHLYGQTESGALMEACQDQWNWVTPLPSTKPFLKFEPVGDDIYHLIVLPGLPTKVLSEREDGSYPTKDLFQKHPTNSQKWKFVARQDDIIVLVNGEKADPIPLEDAVKKHSNVRAAVAFGAQKDSLSMVLVPSERAADLGLSASAIVESILPELALGNSRVPAYARISPESVIVTAADVQLPMTDKATIIRSQFLKQFAEDIDRYYAMKESSGSGAKASSSVEVRGFVRQVITEQLELDEQKMSKFTDESDLFSLGMDSLQATNVRSRVLKGVELQGRSLATNVVFDHPTVELLTSHLLERQVGRGQEVREPREVALQMISKYSDFVEPQVGTMTTEGECVLLTGATGSIGAHILSCLILRSNVSKVVCLVRADDDQSALCRIEGALCKMRLLSCLSTPHMDKITALCSNLSDKQLGLSQSTYSSLLTSVTSVIHNAWPVNFNMNLQSFEQSGTRSTYNLLTLALRSHLQRKPTVILISSLAAVLQATPLPIPERRHGWQGVTNMGYGQSKWVAEEICAGATEKTGLSTRVVRIGQVAGDTQHGIWSATEAFPTTVQCAITVGALPVAEPHDEELSWLPVDKTAATVVDLSLLDRVDDAAVASAVPTFSLFHVANPCLLRWNADFLPALKRQGLQFEPLPQREWVQRLEANPDLSKNPAYKLVDFFKQKYGRVSESFLQPTLDVTLARQLSPSLRKEARIDDDLVGKFLKYWMEEGWTA